MDKLCMPEISAEEFIANADRDDFFRRYGNPVQIREKNGNNLVCMAYEYYEWITQKLEAFLANDNIRYWIYEFQMSQDIKDNLDKLAGDNEMTVDEFFQAAVLSAIQHPAEAAEAVRREYEQHSDNDFDIRLVRKYPIYKGETEAQALKRTIIEEKAEKQKVTETNHRTKKEMNIEEI